MSEPQEQLDTVGNSRRNALRLGAVGAAAMMTIKPAIAQAATSVINCQIPVPGPTGAGMNIAADGSLVPAGTPGSFPGPARAFTGQEVKAALSGGNLYGTPYDASQAYMNYIRKLQYGQSGFTCFASLQMPGR
jgi:hypothetical protein